MGQGVRVRSASIACDRNSFWVTDSQTSYAAPKRDVLLGEACRLVR